LLYLALHHKSVTFVRYRIPGTGAVAGTHNAGRLPWTAAADTAPVSTEVSDEA